MTDLPKKHKKNKESLKNLAILLQLPVKYGWKTALGEALGVDQATISKWIGRSISKNGIETAEDMGFPTDLWMVPVKPYPETPEHMGVPESHLAPDSDRGSYGVPDLDGYEAKEIFIPADIDPFAAAVSGLREIFESRDPIVVSAIKANVRAFQLSVRRERKIGHQSKEIDKLKDKCDEFDEKLAAIEMKLEANLSPIPEEGTINKKGI